MLPVLARPNVRFRGQSGRSRHGPKESAYSHKRTSANVVNPWPATERVVAFYNQRSTAEQHIKEGKKAINWTRLSCHSFRNNAVRLQLHALAYNLGNFLRTLALAAATGRGLVGGTLGG